MAQCDATDGVQDGVIQTPGACNLDMNKLVASGVVTADEASALSEYFSAVRDEDGNVIFPGSPLSAMNGPLPTPPLPTNVTGLDSFMPINKKLVDPNGFLPYAGAIGDQPINWVLLYGYVGLLAYQNDDGGHG
ncbi:hypothetical protein AWV79_02380 [Cupriavidus sp. UYMMa02A]|nr:hypothetical protein AWV79_02380 [Cupriavidus sp. UYMMa02A]